MQITAAYQKFDAETVLVKKKGHLITTISLRKKLKKKCF